MKKSSFRKLIPLIVSVLLFALAIIYVHIFGMSNDDVINRTVNFWIPTCLLGLAYGVFHGDNLVNTIKEGGRLKAAIQIIQALIVVAALVYAYILTTEIIPLGQQIEECMKTDEYRRCNQLLNDQLILRRKRDWSVWLATVIAMVIEGTPHLIRRVSDWWNGKMKREEDQ